MRIRGIQRAQIISRRLRQYVTPAALILLYHRVSDLQTDPQLLSVAPENLEKHCEVIRRYARPISVGKLVECLETDSVPRRSIAITFDDGYHDNLAHAKPLLEKFEIPATVFVSSGYVTGKREFWWDEVERLILEPGELPVSLSIRIGAHPIDFRLNGSARYTAEEASKYQKWDVTLNGRPTARHELYDQLCNALSSVTVPERESALQQLRLWSAPYVKSQPRVTALAPESLVRLSSGGLVEIGAHTVNHPRLCALSSSAQEFEIRESRRQLEALLPAPVTGFAYPFGGRTDYNATSVNLVREAGFQWSCSNFEGLVWPGTDRYQLPRVLIRNWTPDVLSRLIRSWI